MWQKTFNNNSDSKNITQNKKEKKNFNFKDHRKKLEKLIRIQEKQLAALDSKISNQQLQMDQINQNLLNTSGVEAQRLVKDLSMLKNELETLESTWLQVASELEPLQVELKNLLNKP